MFLDGLYRCFISAVCSHIWPEDTSWRARFCPQPWYCLPLIYAIAVIFDETSVDRKSPLTSWPFTVISLYQFGYSSGLNIFWTILSHIHFQSSLLKYQEKSFGIIALLQRLKCLTISDFWSLTHMIKGIFFFSNVSCSSENRFVTAVTVYFGFT